MSAVFFVLFFERGRRNCSIQENEPKRSYFDNYNFASRNEMLIRSILYYSGLKHIWGLAFAISPIRRFFFAYLWFFFVFFFCQFARRSLSNSQHSRDICRQSVSQRSVRVDSHVALMKRTEGAACASWTGWILPPTQKTHELFLLIWATKWKLLQERLYFLI